MINTGHMACNSKCNSKIIRILERMVINKSMSTMITTISKINLIIISIQMINTITDKTMVKHTVKINSCLLLSSVMPTRI